MNAMGTTVAGPSPSSQMGRITSRASSIGGSGTSGKNGSAAPLTQMGEGEVQFQALMVLEELPSSHLFQPNTLFPLALRACLGKVYPKFLQGYSINLKVRNGMDNGFMLSISWMQGKASELTSGTTKSTWTFGGDKIAKITWLGIIQTMNRKV